MNAGIDFGGWSPDGMAERFQGAAPFPHLVIDEFLDRSLAEELVAEFPSIDAMPRSRDYVFGNKHELSSVEEQGTASERFRDLVLSDSFAQLLRRITGLDVWVDPRFHGGGFHQGGDGSYLDMHVDFNVHPLEPSWLRTLNILLYLNPGWDHTWGGQLLLKAAPEEEAVEVEPIFNRAVIMLTGDETFHGYRKVSCPEGLTRRSIATYAYRSADAEVKPHTTLWAPEDAGAGKRFLARNYDALVRAKTRIFGSATARNR